MPAAIGSRRSFLQSGGLAACSALVATSVGRRAAAEGLSRTPAVPDDVDGYVASEIKLRGIAGFAIAVLKDGQLTKAAGYGAANIEHQVPVTVHTRFHLDSLSKLFSAVAVMQLVEQGVIRLDDPIGRWLDGLQPGWSGITVRHLLTHSSGIVDDYAEEFHGSMLLRYDNATLFDHARTQSLEFQPGDKAKYNNLGFFLLTLIIERASGMPSQRYIEQKILHPTGMSESGWPALDDVVPNLAEPYVPGRDGLKVSRDYMASQAGFSYSGVSTVLDLARFTQALDSGKILNASSIAEMERPFRLNNGRNAEFGLAWELASYRGCPTIAKSGSSGAMLMRFPDRHLTVIALGNVALTWPVTSYRSIVHTLAGYFDPELVRQPRADPTIAPALKGQLRDAFRDFLQPNPRRRAFSADWLEATPWGFRQSIAALVASGGAFDVLACDKMRVKGWTSYGVPIAETCSVRVATQGIPVPMTFSFHLNRGGQVAVIDPD
jgi:D-alanyl-D-alanine carboxypeptidase